MLDAGDALSETGLAGVLQTAMRTAFFGSEDYPSEAAKQQTALFNNALAVSLIDYFKANMEVVIKTTDIGLQQEFNGLILQDTAAPTSEKILTIR